MPTNNEFWHLQRHQASRSTPPLLVQESGGEIKTEDGVRKQERTLRDRQKDTGNKEARTQESRARKDEKRSRHIVARRGRLAGLTLLQSSDRRTVHRRTRVRGIWLQTRKAGRTQSRPALSPMSPQPPPMEALPGLAVLVLVVAVVLATLGLVTCVVSHYRTTGGGLGGRARSWHKSEPPPPAPTGPSAPPPAPMVAGMERLSRELRDRQVRLHSVSTDLELGLPPNIALPDGEELPYGSSTRLKIRDPEQESEIYRKCIRPPPNRTVFDGESPPPYRSSSTGLLGGGGDWASTHVVRCHSLSSAGLPCTTPAVVVPSTASAVATRARRLSAFSDSPVPIAVSDLTLVPCRTEGRRTPPGGPAQ